MYLSDPLYALWSIWNLLSLSQHAFIFVLGAVCIYPAFVSFSVIKSLRRIKNYDAEREIADEHRLNALRNRCTNLRRTIEAGFCLFGVILFLHLQTVGLIVMGSAVEAKISRQFSTALCVRDECDCDFLRPAQDSVDRRGQGQHMLRTPIKKGLLGLECRNIAITQIHFAAQSV
jgi:hypothetical protein